MATDVDYANTRLKLGKDEPRIPLFFPFISRIPIEFQVLGREFIVLGRVWSLGQLLVYSLGFRDLELSCYGPGKSENHVLLLKSKVKTLCLPSISKRGPVFDIIGLKPPSPSRPPCSCTSKEIRQACCPYKKKAIMLPLCAKTRRRGLDKRPPKTHGWPVSA